MKEDVAMEPKDKFQQIYHQYYKLMYGVAYDILKNPEDTEDALQEAFIRISQNISKISDPICTKTKNFVVIICKNVSLSMLKKKKGKETEELPLFIEDKRIMANPEAFGEEKYILEQVKDMIRELPDGYQDCLYLSLIYEYTPKEIANLFGMREQTVYKKLKRGKQKLQEKMKKRGLDYEDK